MLRRVVARERKKEINSFEMVHHGKRTKGKWNTEKNRKEKWENYIVNLSWNEYENLDENNNINFWNVGKNFKQHLCEFYTEKSCPSKYISWFKKLSSLKKIISVEEIFLQLREQLVERRKHVPMLKNLVLQEFDTIWRKDDYNTR